METVKAPNFFKDILEDMETEKEERLKMKCELHGEYTAIKSVFVIVADQQLLHSIISILQMEAGSAQNVVIPLICRII